MALLNESNFLNVVQPSVEIPEASIPEFPIPEGPSFGKTLGAAFKENNTITNIYQLAASPSFNDGDFDPLTEENLVGYEDYVNSFIDVSSPEENEFMKAKIDKEVQAKQILKDAPALYSIPSYLASGLVDPLSYVAIAKVAQVASKGTKVVQGLATGAAFGAATGATREGILQIAQETRSREQSFNNILIEASIGSVLGGAWAALSKPARTAAEAIAKDALNVEDSVKVVLSKSGDISSAVGSNLDDQTLAHINNNVVKAISGAGVEQLQSPVVRGLTNANPVVNKLTNELFDHNMILKNELVDEAGETIGRQKSAQLMIERDKASIIQSTAAAKDLYKQHAGVGILRAGIKTPEGKLSWSQFNERISTAIRTGVDDSIPEVVSATRNYQKQIDDWARNLERAEVIPKDLVVKGAHRYLSRIYNVDYLTSVEGRKRFINTLTNHFVKYDKDMNLRVITDYEEALKKSRETAEKAYLKIVSKQDDATHFNEFVDRLSTGSSNLVKNRLINISDEELSPFLVNDASQILTNYVHRASSLVRTQEALQRLGYKSINELRKDVGRHYAKEISEATSDKELKKLTKEQGATDELIGNMFKASAGVLKRETKFTKYFDRLRAYQYLRLLGGVTISSIPELAMPALRHGLLNTLRDGYMPLVRSLKTAKLARDQFKDLDIGLEVEMNNVLEALSDNTVSLGRQHTKLDRGLALASDAFGKASGITYFTAFTRRLAAHVASSDLIRQLGDVSKLSAAQKRRLATGGIGTKDYSIVKDMIDKYSEKVKGSWISNHHLWDDEKAKDLFEGYVQRQTNATILKPGKGDIPFIFQKSDLGRLLFQFKSFSSAATGRIAISSLQARDSRTALGLLYLTMAGSLSGIIKDKLAGRETKDGDALILDGISRSGISGLMATSLLDAGLMASSDTSRRFGGNNLSSTVLGPSVGQIQSIGDLLLNRLPDGDISEKDMDAAKRMLPFQNLFYLNHLSKQINGD